MQTQTYVFFINGREIEATFRAEHNPEAYRRVKQILLSSYAERGTEPREGGKHHGAD